jgi:tripartite-type tricarboxylate transporter receptor subunit TctC
MKYNALHQPTIGQVRLLMRRWSLLLCVLFLGFWCASDAFSQTPNYPNRAVKIVVPSAPGGGTDIVARLLAVFLSQELSQPFVVDNKAGAGNMIGINYVAHASADGYTLLFAPSTLVLNRVLYKSIPFDPIKDFSPVSLAATVPNVLLVSPQLLAQNLTEFLALAKDSKAPLSYASAGVGTSPHMSMELLKSMADLSLQHIPYKGTSPAMTDVMAGQVAAIFANALEAMPLIAAKRVRALAISGDSRLETLPGVPSVSEAGVTGYVSMQWYGMLAPAGTPASVIESLNAAIVGALKTPQIKEKLLADGAQAVGSSPQAFAQLIKSELDKWARVAKTAGIEPQ